MEITLFGCKNTTLEFAKIIKSLNLKISLVTISPDLGESNKVVGYLDLTRYKKYFSTVFVAEHNHKVKNGYRVKEKDQFNLTKKIKDNLKKTYLVFTIFNLFMILTRNNSG